MPNLIKGANANVVWKDSVTLDTKLTKQPRPLVKSEQAQADANAQAGFPTPEEQRNQLKAMEIALTRKLEEEYRKKTEGLEARYRLLNIQLEKDRASIISAAELKSQDILNQASNHAQLMRAKVDEDYEQTIAKARQEGLEEGRQEAKDEVKRVLNILKNTIDGLVSYQDSVTERNKSEIANLAVEIFRKITGMGIDPNDEILISMITEQLRQFRDYKRVKIYLAGYNTYVETLADHLIQNRLLEHSDFLTIETLDNAEVGTCIIETENEMADISISAQLNNLIKNVRNIQVQADDDYEED